MIRLIYLYKEKSQNRPMSLNDRVPKKHYDWFYNSILWMGLLVLISNCNFRLNKLTSTYFMLCILTCHLMEKSRNTTRQVNTFNGTVRTTNRVLLTYFINTLYYENHFLIHTFYTLFVLIRFL